MNVNVNAKLTNEEFKTLQFILGDYKRITLDQYYRFVKTNYTYSDCSINKERFEVAQNLIKKLVEDNTK